MSLTVKEVEAAKGRDKPYKLSDGQGLYLYVSPAGGKSWRANHMVAGKQQTRTYGRFPAMTLADARKEHQRTREAPVAKTLPTFEAMAKAWLLKHLPSLSNPKHRGQVEATLERFAYPTIGKIPIDQIKRTQLTACVKAAQEGGRVETAHRVAGRITSVFDYAVDEGEIEEHPAANLTRVLQARKTKKPMASIPPAEAGALLRAIADYPDLTTRLGLQLLARTFVRPTELRLMRKDEFKEDGAIWVVPPERMKAKEGKRLPHVVPMSKQAQMLVKSLEKMSGSALVIDSPARPGHPISENTLLFALYRLGYKDRMTAHGFRALASTVLNEKSPFKRDVIERQLSHSETDEVRAAYNRAEYLDERRQLMAWWSDWLDAQAG